ncbi:3-keto-disaccharide hydrolase [Tundrisphaera lichenicola]|uniref:3-keto-disaccharide hydrolase n=1 Tax=Tundrisphaera lichenicola TaxID=2029860 RepID=UPI003EB97A8C
MSRKLRLVAGVLIALASGFGAAPEDLEPDFIPLYEKGDPLKNGWSMIGPGSIVEESDGVLVTEGGMGLLWYSKAPFKDFTLRVDYRLTEAGNNSGVFVRFPDPPKDPWDAVDTGYEIQICDGADPEHSTGSIYSFKAAEKKPPAKPTGEWNTYEITVRGQDYSISLNGQVINSYKGSRGISGYVGLQNHDPKSVVRFRHVRIKPLG